MATYILSDFFSLNRESINNKKIVFKVEDSKSIKGFDLRVVSHRDSSGIRYFMEVFIAEMGSYSEKNRQLQKLRQGCNMNELRVEERLSKNLEMSLRLITNSADGILKFLQVVHGAAPMTQSNLDEINKLIGCRHIVLPTQGNPYLHFTNRTDRTDQTEQPRSSL